MSEQLHEAAREPKRLLLLPGGHHRSVQHDEELQAVSRKFIRDARRAAVLRIILVRLAPVPSPIDLAELPFLREALFELVLLAVTGGVLGAWVVLRRLAFFSHAAGSATFPGLVVADASGREPHARRRSPSRSATPAAWSAPARSGREHGEGTALLLVAALAAGVILASDVFESGAAVDRLLFGTLLGLGTGRPRALGRGGASSPPPRPLALGRTWSAVGFDPEGAPRARPARRRAPTCCCSALVARGGRRGDPRRGRAARDRGLRAAGRGRAHAHGEHPRPDRVRARARARRGRRRASTSPTGSTCRPGPPVAVLGAAVCLVAAAARPRRPAHERTARRRRGPGRGVRRRARRSPTSPSRPPPGQSVCVLGPNGGGKTTLFRALLGELEPARGPGRGERAGPRTWRRPSARASTSPSPRSTWP